MPVIPRLSRRGRLGHGLLLAAVLAGASVQAIGGAIQVAPPPTTPPATPPTAARQNASRQAAPPASDQGVPVARWGRFETSFTSARAAENPLQDGGLRVTFTSPSKRTHTVHGFWDGGRTWRVRFSPDEAGAWTYTTRAVPDTDAGLHGKTGTFRVTVMGGDAGRGAARAGDARRDALGANAASTGVARERANRFDRHGPVRVSRNGRFLEHADGKPFFWLADTGWNGALLSTTDEWQDYLDERARQGFTAVQWVTTQWRASPTGDRLGEPAFTGRERISVNPAFFQRLDAKVEALNRAGLLSAPVLLWAIGGGSDPSVNPGFSLPDDQAILLARYMVARWQAHDVIWILPGDGDYRGDKAARWVRIGRAVFGEDGPHAPVVLHPGGMHWVLREFQQEPWVSIHGYQSGHGDDEKTLRWMTEGPPARDWTLEPARPFINLEPPYEGHVAYQSKGRIAPHTVRRAVYWSLLNAPPAGVSYGGHGVWGWDDGTRTPTDHPGTGVPLPWKQALTMPGAEQMGHVAALFTSIDYTRLRPAPELLAEQPGTAAAARFIAAAASESRDLVVIYTPESQAIVMKTDAVGTRDGRGDVGAARGTRGTWFDPRTGVRTKADGAADGPVTRFQPPGEGDWILLLARE